MFKANSKYNCTSKQCECASASSAAASFSCANMSFVVDAAMLASIIFILAVLRLHILGVLVAMISIMRIMLHGSRKPKSWA